ncbi:MAG: hypothetical protein IPO27_07795 [Bacteroidetes bacterium]|nr:hypothetical protein [Bacteroidota bacterium]
MHSIILKRKTYIILFLITLISNASAQSYQTTNLVFDSKVFGDYRNISVYLPPSYFASNATNYPVLYVLDTEVTNETVLSYFESEARLGTNIPEHIIVTVTLYPPSKFKPDLLPAVSIASSTSSQKVIDFFESELVPFIRRNYRASSYKTIGGQQYGGLFAAYASLVRPDLANGFIAIRPNLEWNNSFLKGLAKRTLKEQRDFKTNLFITSNQNKNKEAEDFMYAVAGGFLSRKHTSGFIILFVMLMLLVMRMELRSRKFGSVTYNGVPFALGVLAMPVCLYLISNYIPSNSNFQLRQFKEESNATTEVASYKWAMYRIFENSRIPDGRINKPSDVVNYKSKVLNYYGQLLPIPMEVWKKTIYANQDNHPLLSAIEYQVEQHLPQAHEDFNYLFCNLLIQQNKLQMAETVAVAYLRKNQYSYRNREVMARINYEKKLFDAALSDIQFSISMAKQQRARTYILSELEEIQRRIENRSTLQYKPESNIKRNYSAGFEPI